MRKTDKKIDNRLRVVLTSVCQTALEEIDGFVWLTHLVDYASFPKSLKVVCVFECNDKLSTFITADSRSFLETLMQNKLSEIAIDIKKIGVHLVYDTEENCNREHHGNWAKRLG